jgi:hypothetical protein
MVRIMAQVGWGMLGMLFDLAQHLAQFQVFLTIPHQKTINYFISSDPHQLKFYLT